VSSGARSHYHADRKTLQSASTARLTPGPGTYWKPSDFGFYESKNSPRLKSARLQKSKRLNLELKPFDDEDELERKIEAAE